MGRGPHWEWLGRYLDEDEFGRWFEAPADTRCSRPGVSFLEVDPWVSLVPRDAGWVAGFYPATKGIGLYVDMTTVAHWRPLAPGLATPRWEVTMVDLDLDVILTREGHLFVDDEDVRTAPGPARLPTRGHLARRADGAGGARRHRSGT